MGIDEEELLRARRLTNPEMEQGLLVGFVHSAKQTVGALVQADPRDFSDERHRNIYKVIQAMKTADGTIDITTVTGELTKIGMDPEEFAFLLHEKYEKQREMDFELAKTYLGKLRQYAVSRLMADAMDDVRKAALTGKEKPEDLIAKVTGSLDEAAELAIVGFGGTRPLLDGIKEVMTRIEERWESGRRPDLFDHLRTTYADLDSVIGGLYPELICFAGRPDMGASEFAMNIAYNLTNVMGKTVLYFLTNLPKTTFVERLVCLASKQPYPELRDGKIDQEKMTNMLGSIGQMVGNNLYIDASPKLSLEKVIEVSRFMKRRNVDLVIVDDVLRLNATVAYQRPDVLSGDTTYTDAMNERLNVIAYGLDRLAHDLKVPVIAVTGCSSEAERTKAGFPRLRHVVGPALQKLANTVLLFHKRGPSPTARQLFYRGDIYKFDDLSSRMKEEEDERRY
jgi:replicative DNA helicase